jgi:hypothetical protein
VDDIDVDFGEIGWGAVDWIGLAQDRDKWRNLENAVMKFRIYKMLGSSRVATQMMASLAVLRPIELVEWLITLIFQPCLSNI